MEAMCTSVVMLREWRVMYTGLSTQLHKNRLVSLAIYGFVFLGGPSLPLYGWHLILKLLFMFCYFLTNLTWIIFNEADKALYIVLFTSTHFEAFRSLQKNFWGVGAGVDGI